MPTIVCLTTSAALRFEPAHVRADRRADDESARHQGRPLGQADDGAGRGGGHEVAERLLGQLDGDGPAGQGEEGGHGDPRGPGHAGEPVHHDGGDDQAAEHRPDPDGRTAEQGGQALPEHGGLDAEPAEQADREDDADEAGAVAAEPGPAGQEGGGHSFAHPGHADGDGGELQDGGADGDGEHGVPEGHAHAEGGAEQELGQGAEQAESLYGHGGPAVAGVGGHALERVVVADDSLIGQRGVSRFRHAGSCDAGGGVIETLSRFAIYEKGQARSTP